MIKILKPGLLTSIQDMGRYGFQRFGVVASGAMDSHAHRISNLLIGNDENLPTLEMTLLGPRIEFYQDSLIAICGGDLSPEINGIALKLWRPILVKKGSILQFSKRRSGCRTYLSVAGGFQVNQVMNSCSTYFRAKLGGFKGRALTAGDQLSFHPPSKLSLRILTSLQKEIGNRAFLEAKWMITNNLIPSYTNNPIIRAMNGRQFHLFNQESQERLYNQSFIVTHQSDRMGYRLNGPTLALKETNEMITEAVTMGTIQVPPDGNPIVLLADRQTTGGYPKIAQISAVDLPLIAQTLPGDRLRFKNITHSEAELLYLTKEKDFLLLKQAILLKYR